MKAYWIAKFKKINNYDRLKKYSEKVIPVIKKFGGKPLVRGGKFKTFSSDNFLKIVIWEFPSFEKAIKCHECEEYQDGWKLAENSTDRSLQIVEGFNTE